MLLLLTILSASAQGDEALAAEHVRLSEVMKNLAGRNAWEGVDRTYREMESQGIAPTYDDHYIAAQAAWALGDADSTRERLERALSVRSDAEVKQWLAEIHNSYSAVQLSGGGPLQIAESPFAADQRAALAFAQEKLEADSVFAGMLPNGSYTFGSETFELFPGSPEVVIGRSRRSRSGSGGGSGLSLGPLQPTLSAGPALTQVGAPLSAGIQPAGFGGPGVRLGLGPEISLGDALGAKIEVGYQGLLSGSGTLHRGLVWTAATWRVTDRIQILAGPEVGLGRAKTVGLDTDTYKLWCAENPDDARCGWVDLGAFRDVEVVGTVRSAGGTLGVILDGAELAGMRSGVGLIGGMQTDTYRRYPWAQVAFTLRREP